MAVRLAPPDREVSRLEPTDIAASVFLPYVTRPALEMSATAGIDQGDAPLCAAIEGSMVFGDVSGFTKMSERLARHGKIGAEEVADGINHCFEQLLDVSYQCSGSLLKFGGDALLLLFPSGNHQLCAIRAAVAMRAALREAQNDPLGAGRLNLRMSVGIHSGVVNLFMVGTSHRELLISGPAASETVRM